MRLCSVGIFTLCSLLKIGSLSIRIRPRSGWCNPATSPIRVDLPPPDGPKTPILSPSMVKSISRKNLPNFFCTETRNSISVRSDHTPSQPFMKYEHDYRDGYGHQAERHGHDIASGRADILIN